MRAKLAVKIVGYVVEGRAFSRIQKTRESDVGESGRSKFGEARDSLFQKTGRCGEGAGGKHREFWNLSTILMAAVLNFQLNFH